MSELSNRVAQVERERDEARAELAEVRRIVTETLPDLEAQPDRETTVRRVAALATRYQYERDAAALLRKDVDRWEATSQAQAIEEHKLRAEVERLTNELNAALNQIDRGAFPDWTCAECGSQAGFDEVRYEAGDADMACRTCGGTDVRESAREAAGALGDKYDALKAEVERLRAAHAVCAVDVEAAAKEIADGFALHLGDDDTRTESLIVAILRKHTCPIDQPSPAAPRGEWTEEQREAAWDMHLRTRGYTIDCNAARDHICLALAHVAPLFAPEPAQRPPFVVDRGRFNGIANRAGLAVARAIDECIAEIERQRAEWAGGAT